MRQGDTISAVVTPPGAGGVGIIRLSGEEAIAVADAMFRARNGKKLEEVPSSSFLYGHLTDDNGDILDEALVLVMKKPHSYTREDVAEIQCHGGSVVLRTILERTFILGARPAERGEFTKRAFLNGRLDLSEAQAVMDVVGAKTEKSLRLASGRLAGRFSGKVKELRKKILEQIAHLEATIDFPEDEIEEVIIDKVHSEISKIRDDIYNILKSAHAGRVLREGLKTAIIGKPNVGKSSLLNAVLFEERAIVTDIPGTTRDSIEAYADVGGIPLSLIDTAGIRETHDEVERIGIERAIRCAREASLVLAVFDGSSPLTAEDDEIISIAKEREAVFLLNKSDRIEENHNELPLMERHIRASVPEASVLRVSAATGDGLEELADLIAEKAFGDGLMTEEAAFVPDTREADILRRAAGYLEDTLRTAEGGMSADFIVIDLRSAWESLGEITGETAGEDIIDEIFRKFCLGK